MILFCVAFFVEFLNLFSTVIDDIVLRKFKKICEYKKQWIATKQKLDIMHIEKPSSNLQIKNKFSDCESNGNTVFVLQDQPHSSNFGGELVI